jgi:hypothetical protein
MKNEHELVQISRLGFIGQLERVLKKSLSLGLAASRMLHPA